MKYYQQTLTEATKLNASGTVHVDTRALTGSGTLGWYSKNGSTYTLLQSYATVPNATNAIVTLTTQTPVAAAAGIYVFACINGADFAELSQFDNLVLEQVVDEAGGVKFAKTFDITADATNPYKFLFTETDKNGATNLISEFEVPAASELQISPNDENLIYETTSPSIPLSLTSGGINFVLTSDRFDPSGYFEINRNWSEFSSIGLSDGRLTQDLETVIVGSHISLTGKYSDGSTPLLGIGTSYQIQYREMGTQNLNVISNIDNFRINSDPGGLKFVETLSVVQNRTTPTQFDFQQTNKNNQTTTWGSLNIPQGQAITIDPTDTALNLSSSNQLKFAQTYSVATNTTNPAQLQLIQTSKGGNNTVLSTFGNGFLGQKSHAIVFDLSQYDGSTRHFFTAGDDYTTYNILLSGDSPFDTFIFDIDTSNGSFPKAVFFNIQVAAYSKLKIQIGDEQTFASSLGNCSGIALGSGGHFFVNPNNNIEIISNGSLAFGGKSPSQQFYKPIQPITLKLENGGVHFAALIEFNTASNDKYYIFRNETNIELLSNSNGQILNLNINNIPTLPAVTDGVPYQALLFAAPTTYSFHGHQTQWTSSNNQAYNDLISELIKACYVIPIEVDSTINNYSTVNAIYPLSQYDVPADGRMTFSSTDSVLSQMGTALSANAKSLETKLLQPAGPVSYSDPLKPFSLVALNNVVDTNSTFTLTISLTNIESTTTLVKYFEVVRAISTSNAVDNFNIEMGANTYTFAFHNGEERKLILATVFSAAQMCQAIELSNNLFIDYSVAQPDENVIPSGYGSASYFFEQLAGNINAVLPVVTEYPISSNLDLLPDLSKNSNFYYIPIEYDIPNSQTLILDISGISATTSDGRLRHILVDKTSYTPDCNIVIRNGSTISYNEKLTFNKNGVCLFALLDLANNDRHIIKLTHSTSIDPTDTALIVNSADQLKFNQDYQLKNGLLELSLRSEFTANGAAVTLLIQDIQDRNVPVSLSGYIDYPDCLPTSSTPTLLWYVDDTYVPSSAVGIQADKRSQSAVPFGLDFPSQNVYLPTNKILSFTLSYTSVDDPTTNYAHPPLSLDNIIITTTAIDSTKIILEKTKKDGSIEINGQIPLIPIVDAITKPLIDTHEDNHNNPHQVTLQQAATSQGTTDTTIAARMYLGSVSDANKYLTQQEIANSAISGVKYRGELKYGTDTIGTRDSLSGMTPAENHNLTDGDTCGVHETQKTYVWNSGTWSEITGTTDVIGDMYRIEYWYGTWDGTSYSGDVQAEIICRQATPSVVYDLFLDRTIIPPNSITDEQIGSRTLTDAAASSSLFGLTQTLTNFLQNIRNNIKYLFARFDTTSGAALSAEKLQTARTITVDPTSNIPASFDGSADVSAGVSVVIDDFVAIDTLPTATTSTLSSWLSTIRQNVKWLFSNKQNSLAASTNGFLVTHSGTVGTEGTPKDPADFAENVHADDHVIYSSLTPPNVRQILTPADWTSYLSGMFIHHTTTDLLDIRSTVFGGNFVGGVYTVKTLNSNNTIDNTYFQLTSQNDSYFGAGTSIKKVLSGLGPYVWDQDLHVWADGISRSWEEGMLVIIAKYGSSVGNDPEVIISGITVNAQPDHTGSYVVSGINERDEKLYIFSADPANGNYYLSEIHDTTKQDTITETGTNRVLLAPALAGGQPGSNTLKTVNGTSIFGSGNITTTAIPKVTRSASTGSQTIDCVASWGAFSVGMLWIMAHRSASANGACKMFFAQWNEAGASSSLTLLAGGGADDAFTATMSGGVVTVTPAGGQSTYWTAYFLQG